MKDVASKRHGYSRHSWVDNSNNVTQSDIKFIKCSNNIQCSYITLNINLHTHTILNESELCNFNNFSLKTLYAVAA